METPVSTSVPWTIPLHRLSRTPVVSQMQIASAFAFVTFPKSKVRKLLGTSARLYSLYRWEKGSPEKCKNPPNIPWLFIGLGAGIYKFSALFQVWIFHPAIGWSCRVVGSWWKEKKSHNRQWQSILLNSFGLYDNMQTVCFFLNLADLFFKNFQKFCFYWRYPENWNVYRELIFIEHLLYAMPNVPQCVISVNPHNNFVEWVVFNSLFYW